MLAQDRVEGKTVLSCSIIFQGSRPCTTLLAFRSIAINDLNVKFPDTETILIDSCVHIAATVYGDTGLQIYRQLFQKLASFCTIAVTIST